MLETEFQYYLDNQASLVEQYNGKFVVISGNKITGVYDTKTEAYNDSCSKMKLGTFLIQKVSPGDEAYTQTFSSRVIIKSIAK